MITTVWNFYSLHDCDFMGKISTYGAKVEISLVPMEQWR